MDSRNIANKSRSPKRRIEADDTNDSDAVSDTFERDLEDTEETVTDSSPTEEEEGEDEDLTEEDEEDNIESSHMELEEDEDETSSRRTGRFFLVRCVTYPQYPLLTESALVVDRP